MPKSVSIMKVMRVKRRFMRDAKGSVAVEFALTAIPFFTLLFAIMEAGIIFFASSTLDQSVNDTARLIRTGQAQTASTTKVQMIQKICDNVVLLSSCTTKLKIDVRVFTNFSSVSFAPVMDSSGAVKDANLTFNMGAAGDIILVRAFYVWSIMSPFSTGLANNTTGTRLIQSSVAFRNEPYTS